MSGYNIAFISDEDLYRHVAETIAKYRFSIDLQKFNKNIIDPIKLTFDSKIYQKSIKEIVESEIIRQMDKSNTNHIGYFHQNIFRYLGNGWEVPDSGFDLINPEKKIYVEMKNKHNTMNAASSQKTYIAMQHKILEGADVTCMLVEVIAKNSQNIPWKISLEGKQFEHANIRRVSIDKFYEIVTGEKEAFKILCEVLPIVIDNVMKNSKESYFENSVFEELSAIGDEDILRSLYLLAFEKYDGFGNFRFSQ